MKLFITHESALAYWKSAYCGLITPNSYLKRLPSEALYKETIDSEMLARKGVGIDPLHITFGRPEQRLQRKGIVTHCMTGAVPAGSFEPLASAFGRPNPDIQVASPELTFCQTAHRISFQEAVHLGFLLCANYHPNDLTGEPDKRDPLTSARALQDYATRYGDQPGAKAARRAARCVCPGAARSAMEVAVAVLLTLPRKDGGYGLPQCILNGEVLIPGKGVKAAPISLHGDLIWPKQRLVVEYDSNLHHRTPDQLATDAERRNDMQDAGWRVMTITWSQVANRAKMDAAAAQLARALGVKNSYVARHTAARRDALRKLVLTPAMRGSWDIADAANAAAGETVSAGETDATDA